MQLLERLRAYSVSRDVTPYIVGGFVRDSLLGRQTCDLDLALEGDVAAVASEVAAELGGTAIPMDRERGVHRVVARSGGETWQVDLAALHGPIEADLARRDFTVDAMALPLAEAEGPPDAWPVLDPLGGREDLARRLIRATGPSVFQDDPVRLVRAFRLATALGFTVEPWTAERIRREARLVAQVSGERVRDELLAVLSMPGLEHSLGGLARTGLLDEVFPELAVGHGVSQPKEHFWDVFDHNVQAAVMAERILDADYRAEDTAARSIPWEPWLDEHFAQEASDGHDRATLLKLTALLHDVAKPQTKTFEPSGRMRFFGHADEGARIAGEAVQRLRLSGRGTARISTMIREHLRPGQLAQPGQLPTGRAVYRYFRDAGDVAVDTLYLNLADFLAARGPTLELDDWRAHCERIAHTLRQGTTRAAPERVAKLVSGHDLAKLFGLAPGPCFHVLLDQVHQAQAAGEVGTREEALALLGRLIPTTSTQVGEDRAAT